MQQTTDSRPQLSPRRALVSLIPALLLAGLLAWLFLGGGLERLRPSGDAWSNGLMDSSDLGKPAPGFALVGLGGREHQLADYRGQIVLLNFWATWCIPCRAEMPEIERAYQAYRDRGFVVLAVNLQEREEEIRPFVAELGLSFPVVLDQDGATSRAYRTRALPTSFLVDRDGTIRFARVGTVTYEMLERELAKVGLD